MKAAYPFSFGYMIVQRKGYAIVSLNLARLVGFSTLEAGLSHGPQGGMKRSKSAFGGQSGSAIESEKNQSTTFGHGSILGVSPNAINVFLPDSIFPQTLGRC